jgi:hypothetical protein
VHAPPSALDGGASRMYTRAMTAAGRGGRALSRAWGQRCVPVSTVVVPPVRAWPMGWGATPSGLKPPPGGPMTYAPAQRRGASLGRTPPGGLTARGVQGAHS